MNRDDFIKKFNSAKDEYNADRFIKIADMSISIEKLKNRGVINLVISMEEISELISALLSDDKFEILEELADVAICIEWIVDILNINMHDFYKAVMKQYEAIIAENNINKVISKANIIDNLSKFIKEISKYIRGKNDTIDIDKLAKCYISLTCIKALKEISVEESNKAINVKLDKIYNYESKKRFRI